MFNIKSNVLIIKHWCKFFWDDLLILVDNKMTSLNEENIVIVNKKPWKMINQAKCEIWPFYEEACKW